MKIFLLLLVFITSILAQDRPKIALVLSGGGARGGAHVGVLKVLQEKKIPIDLIVGTSMGALVGGLYASGKTPDEIDELLTTTDWKRYIRTDFNRADTPMRKKAIEYRYQGRLGLGVNAEDEIVLPTGVLKRQPMLFKFLNETQYAENIKNFDDFPIPFRAVATNIKNGNKVVLKSGSLAKAIYASASIPGGFQPINIDGVDLVDGGVSDNMPIDVAKKMGADIIIAVDVSENFDKDLDVNSYFVVMGQLVNILMRKNANKAIATLDKNDILLTPDLDGFNGLDADKYVEIIQRGVDVTKAAYESKLKQLSLSDEDYAKYQQKHRKMPKYNPPVIDEIKINNPTYLGNQSILNRLHVHAGEKLDEKQLRADLLHLYNMMIFDSVDYEIKQKNGKNILIISTKPSWDNHGEIRFSLGLQDDFKGHSSYSMKLGYTKFGMNEYGGEWKSDFEIGRNKLAKTEFFQPFDSMQRYYLKPSVEYQERLDYFPIKNYIPTLSGNRELNLRRYGATMAAGMDVTTDYEFEVGISIYRDNEKIDSFELDKNYDARPLYISLKTDSLDNLNFPNKGVKSEIMWRKEMEGLGSDYDSEQVYVEVEKPISFGRHNLTAYAKYGNTYRDDNLPMYSTFTLGGLFNLSGYAPYTLNDDNMFLGLLKYRYQLKDGGFFGTLNAPVYVGVSAEIGDAWGSRIHPHTSYSKAKKSAALYLAADTFLGPFYLAYGATVDGEQSAYLYLGEKF